MRKLFLMALPLILLWGALAAGEIYKNTASQKIALFAQDMSNGEPKTGDAANLTAYISKDHGAVAALTDTSAAELDADYAPGWYVFDLAQAETNAEVLLITAISATSDVNVAGAYVVTRAYTVDANGMLEGVVMDVSKSAGVADTADVETALEAVLDDRDVTEARMAYLLMVPNVAAELASETYGLNALLTAIGGGGSAAGWQYSTHVASVTSTKVFTLAAGPDVDSWFGRREWLIAVKDADGADPNIPAVETISSYTASSKTVTLAAALPFTPEVNDVAVLVPMAWTRPGGGRIGASR